MKLRTRVRRIGVTGSARAGKTVFLISLINQLEADGLAIPNGGNPVTIRRLRRLPCNGTLSTQLSRIPGLSGLCEGKQEFNYDLLRRHLSSDKAWPKKTVDSSFFRCRFRRSDSKFTEDEVEFFDFPGERVADVTMIRRSYAEWSHQVLSFLRNDPQKNEHSSPFLKAIESGVSDAAELVRLYKLALASMIQDCHPLISPSTFLVDLNGNVADGETPEQIVNGGKERPARFSGLEGAEFVPLSPDFQKSAPEVFSQMRRNYEIYQRKVVAPFAGHLLSCHKLLFLMDVTDMLGSGPQKLNDTQQMIGELFKCLDSKSDLMRFLSETWRISYDLVASMMGRKWERIEGVAFVATKADKVHSSDLDKLVPLIRDAAKKPVLAADLRSVEYLSCSAVQAAQSHPDDAGVLVGRPLFVEKGDKVLWLSPDEEPRKISVPRLPDEWPDRWSPEKYIYPDFYPIIPAVFGRPPRQKGLENVMKFILED